MKEEESEIKTKEEREKEKGSCERGSQRER